MNKIKKHISLIFLLLPLFINAQGKNGCPTEKSKSYNCLSVKENILSRLPDQEYKMDTHFEVVLESSLKRNKDLARIDSILLIVNRVLNDSDFWKALEMYDRYQFARWSNELNDTWEVISGKQIVNALINGDPENGSRPKNKTIRLKLKLYGPPIATFFESAVGKDGNDGFIYNKRWFFRKHSFESIGSNWIHELAHSSGLRHCSKCHQERDYSIPYVINRVFIEVAKKHTAK